MVPPWPGAAEPTGWSSIRRSTRGASEAIARLPRRASCYPGRRSSALERVPEVVGRWVEHGRIGLAIAQLGGAIEARLTDRVRDARARRSGRDYPLAPCADHREKFCSHVRVRLSATPTGGTHQSGASVMPRKQATPNRLCGRRVCQDGAGRDENRHLPATRISLNSASRRAPSRSARPPAVRVRRVPAQEPCAKSADFSLSTRRTRRTHLA